MASKTEWVRMERLIAAPLEKVWEMWTRPELFAQWYGPDGMQVPVAELNVVVGGTRRVCMSMTTPDRQMAMWFIGNYTQVDPPYRLAYTESMSDEDGNILSAAQMGMPEGHPETTEVVLELQPEDGGTRLTLTHVGVPADSGGASGWTQAVDKLVALLQ